MGPFNNPPDGVPHYLGSADLNFLTERLSFNTNPPSLASSISDQSTRMASPKTPAHPLNRTNGGFPMLKDLGSYNPGNPSSGNSFWQTNNTASTSNSALPNLPMQNAMFNASTAQVNMLDVPQTIITERHLQYATSYAFHRGNGQYTRLVALDELPPIMGLRSTQGPERLIVLPIPHCHQPLPPVKMASLTSGYLMTPESTPSPNMSTRDMENIAGGASSSFSNHSTYSRGSFGTPTHSNGPKREKVYCDKWVHDGVCAFAQQGCKYKHEMPTDVATQRALGLFHGLPAWYKREHYLELKSKGDGAKGSALGKGDAVAERIKEGLRAGQPAELSSWRIGAPNRSLGGFGDINSQASKVSQNSFGELSLRASNLIPANIIQAISLVRANSCQ